jgi:hypothetical protein
MPKGFLRSGDNCLGASFPHPHPYPRLKLLVHPRSEDISIVNYSRLCDPKDDGAISKISPKSEKQETNVT